MLGLQVMYIASAMISIYSSLQGFEVSQLQPCDRFCLKAYQLFSLSVFLIGNILDCFKEIMYGFSNNFDLFFGNSGKEGNIDYLVCDAFCDWKIADFTT